MTKVEAVIRGWLDLTPDEKRQVETVINKFNAAGPSERTVIKESYETRAQGGPNVTSGGCPCCGRR